MVLEGFGRVWKGLGGFGKGGEGWGGVVCSCWKVNRINFHIDFDGFSLLSGGFSRISIEP